ncbi:MAG: DUF624 domain-containing protein [Firmicutes bacterium]|jgi:uncharacterized membrane protein YesL|nr:DUF624 domain-containing protein [Bacillota bacterium]NLL89081.1 DUF624 domain-containing protein [Bacillota bacterium]HKM18117.1 DUF624 domain-containing protein [Limnochordia bacterium]
MGVSQSAKLILNALKKTWDHITVLVVLNLVWFFLAFSPMFIDSLIKGPDVINLVCTILALLLLGPVSAAMHYLIHRILTNEELSVEEFIKGLKRFFWRSELLVLLGLAALLIIVFNFSHTANHEAVYMRILNGIWLYMALLWVLLLQYAFPFLVQQDINIFLALKRSAMLLFDNLLVSLMLLLLGGFLTFISVMLVIPLIILWFAMISFMQNYVTVELLQKYSNDHSKDLD